MSIEITQDLQKVLETAAAMEEVVSVQATEVPAHLLSQVEAGEYIYLDCVIKVETEDEVSVGFVVPTKIIDADSYKNLPIQDLVSCSCVTMSGEEDDFCVTNPYYNTGKTTYFVRYPDQYLVRLVDTSPELVIIPTDNLKILVDKLKQVDKVNAIKVEHIVSETLKQSLDDKSVMIRAYIDINHDKILDHSVCFTVTELVYETESGHEWAVNNLIELIEQNNAE
jgi:hypothetical protein